MKALTVLQPWASLIIKGHKRFETRSWPAQYRGLLGIHAGKSTVNLRPGQKFPLGAILGTVRLVECHRMTPEFIRMQSPEELALGHWEPGRWAWEFEAPLEFDQPVPCRGQQGLWNWEGRQW